MLRKLVEKDEYKEEKYNDINNDTKEVEINKNREVVETDNDELVVGAANNAPPPQYAPTTTMTMAAAAEEGGGENNLGAKDGDDDKADDTRGERGVPQSKTETTKMTMMMTKTITKRTLWTFYTP